MPSRNGAEFSEALSVIVISVVTAMQGTKVGDF